MADLEIKKAENQSFFKELLHRRVLQITGFYLGGGWGVLQFLDWIVDRYLLSPFLVDLALTIIASLLPTIVTIAYFHGIPGKNKWRKREKILIPVNLVLAIILVIFMFGSKDLSSIASRVSVTDENGRKIEKVVPKKGVVKELTVFYFDNDSGENNADWMQYGFADILMLDLAQDPFLNVKSPSSSDPLKGFYIYQKLKDAGFPDAIRTPVMLQKKIAEDLNAENFMTGAIVRSGDLIELKITIFRTKDNSVVAEKKFIESDMFSIIDNLAVFVKKSLKLPSYKNKEIVDLPIKDMYTSSIKAARLVTEAEMVIIKNNNYGKAQQLFEKAIEEDSTFTIAYAQLSEIYALNNKADKWKSTIKVMMNHLYKLPEKMQMQLKAGYYLSVKGEPEKADLLSKMIIKLYPNDISNYYSFASRMYLTGNYQESISNYKKILEMEPEKYEILEKIGQAYEGAGDLENAIINYEKFSEKFPKNAAGFLRIGKIEEESGNFAKAAELYEKALLLDPEKISTMLLIASLDVKAGKFGDAGIKYEEALESAKSPREKSQVLGEMEDFYRLLGQQKKAMSMMDMFYKFNDLYLPPLQTLIVKIYTVDIYLKNGREKYVKKFLDEARLKLFPPFNKVIAMGYILYYKHLGDLNKAEGYLSDIKEFVKLTGNKQFLLIAELWKAGIAYQRKEFDKALTIYKSILEQDRNNINVFLKISNCLKNLNEINDAIEYTNKALKVSPYHPEVNYTAALLYSLVNRKEEGLDHLGRAIKGWENADQDFKPALEANALLSKLAEEKKSVK